ncbi:hypothetical protein [Peptoniphilus vaginalis]|uniref:hypothetical protein n=1 Tax=Peptoniphilus vaginalis TaxID=1756987 RepID=UPI0023F7DDDC|nr:hypothetical protein [Peptoniphilus vaginalis]
MSEDFNSSKNSKSVQKRKCPILSMSPILAVLFSIICIALIIKYKAYSADSIGSIIAASIAVLGVYFTVMENKKKTYNEIVTRERIEWLHKMQVKLANYLEPTSSTVATSDSNEEEKASVEDNVTANRLYYELSFNINHHKDADALKALNNYHYARYGKPDKIKVNLALMDEVKLELVLDKGEEDELLFKIKDERELKKLKDIISSGELEKIKIGKENENLDEGREFEKELALLKKDLSEEFTKIFNETWGDIKREAD